MREGEILGLRWADDETGPGLDLDRAEVRILEQLQHGKLSPLKRGASRRVLHLRPWVVDLLRDYRENELVSRMLGHSSISITADTYEHWTDEGRVDVAQPLGRALIGEPRQSISADSAAVLVQLPLMGAPMTPQ